MKGFVFIFMFLFFLSSCYALRINEIQANPAGSDSGNEWVELFSEDEVDLSGYRLVNDDGEVFELSGKFSGYYIVEFEKLWLDNNGEQIFLYDGERLIDESEVFEDLDEDKTWQFCGDWVFEIESKREINNCGGVKGDVEKESVVSLGSKKETQDIKTKDNVLFESKTEHVKKYAIYFFSLLCVFLIGLLLVENSRLKNEYKNNVGY